MRSLLRIVPAICVTVCFLAGAPVFAQARKRLLVIGEEKGYRHDAVTHAMVDDRAPRQRDRPRGTR